MKFLLGLVSCCGCSSSFCGGGGGGVSVPESPSSESTTLVPVVSRRSFRRRRRGRYPGARGSGGDVEWRPSLFAISENDVVMEKQRHDRAAVKRKSDSSDPDKIRIHGFGKDYEQSSMPTYTPAYSPTPFMF